jgi:hypothetical protein
MDFLKKLFGMNKAKDEVKDAEAEMPAADMTSEQAPMAETGSEEGSSSDGDTSSI